MSEKRKYKKDEPKILPYSDINLSNWKDYEHILTDSLWLMNSRNRGNGHSFEYHGNFIPQIANQMFLRYSKERDIILDMFLGSGTSAIEASNLNRRLVGVELKEELANAVREKIPEGKNADIRVLQGDSASDDTVTLVRKEIVSLSSFYADLLILHPPYADIIRFSDLPEDLSNAPSTDEFLEMFGRVAKNGYELLAPERFAVLVIGDKYANSELVPLGFLCMQKMLEAGFITKSIIVKNIEGNEIGKGRTNNLWRYRALAGGFYIFKHEYIMVFQKKVR